MRLSLQQFMGSLAADSEPLDPCFLWSWLCLIRDAIKTAGQIELVFMPAESNELDINRRYNHDASE